MIANTTYDAKETVTDRLVHLAFEEMKSVGDVFGIFAVSSVIHSFSDRIIEANVDLILPNVAKGHPKGWSALVTLEKVSTALLVQHDASPMLTGYYESCDDPFADGARIAKRMLDAILTHLAGES